MWQKQADIEPGGLIRSMPQIAEAEGKHAPLKAAEVFRIAGFSIAHWSATNHGGDDARPSKLLGRTRQSVCSCKAMAAVSGLRGNARIASVRRRPMSNHAAGSMMRSSGGSKGPRCLKLCSFARAGRGHVSLDRQRSQSCGPDVTVAYIPQVLPADEVSPMHWLMNASHNEATLRYALVATASRTASLNGCRHMARRRRCTRGKRACQEQKPHGPSNS